MADTYWTKTTFNLAITFWLLQVAAVISHITIITIWIGFLGEKSNVEVIPHIYTTLLITTIFVLGFLFTELFFHARSSLSLPRYQQLQRLKIRISLLEMLALAYISHGVEDASGVVPKVVLATGCLGIPLNFSLGLAAFMARRERKKTELESKEADEEEGAPLLDGP